MLTRGLYMDSVALQVLTDRGLGHLTGVRVARRPNNGLMEHFTDDPLNAPHAGDIRDARIEFWHDPRGIGDELAPVADNVRVLANLEDYFNRLQGPCMTAYENELGGRVVGNGLCAVDVPAVSRKARAATEHSGLADRQPPRPHPGTATSNPVRPPLPRPNPRCHSPTELGPGIPSQPGPRPSASQTSRSTC